MKRMVLIGAVTLIVCGALNAGAGDLALVNANMGRETSVPNGGVSLSPRLTVVPGRKTLLTEETQLLYAKGSTNPITWFVIENPSGGTLSAVNSTSVLYQAGVTSSVVDTIQAWDGENQFGRTYMNVISAAEVAQLGKAIVICGRSGPSDSVWAEENYLANNAYNTLMYLAYSKTNVQYLNPVPDQDVDLNGLNDDIDAASNTNTAEHAFTTFAAGSDKLFVYMVNHGENPGGNGYMYLDSGQKLYASVLDDWLDTLQATYTNMDVTVVVDCCYAGSFVTALDYSGPASRIVIAAVDDSHLTYFMTGGLVSFSDAFFNGLMQGLSVQGAFGQAEETAASWGQVAWLDDTGDGVYDGNDGMVAATTFIGATFVEGKDIPLVASVCGNQILTEGTIATLWADDISSGYDIERVWCTVFAPSHHVETNSGVPVSDLPEVDLAYSNTIGRYEGRYSGFTEEGTYKVIYYAKDIWGSVSLPKVRYVTQASFDERVLIVAAGATTDVKWAKINTMANTAFSTLDFRGFASNALCYLNADPAQDGDRDGEPDVDDAPTLANIAFAITNWAATTNYLGPADQLTVYVVGTETNGEIRLSATESLSAAQLDGWLDLYQSTNNRKAIVVLETTGAGAFIPNLKPPSDSTRVVVSCTMQGAPAHWLGGGCEISFSACFFGAVKRGHNVYEAYWRTKRALQEALDYCRVLGDQIPLLDGNGDGVAPPKGTVADKEVAQSIWIGTAFKTGDSLLEIGDWTPDTLLAGADTLTLWAADVSGEGISNVYCYITAPDYTGTNDLPELDLLWDAVDYRYENVYSNFTVPGTYSVTYCARDTNDNLSLPVHTLVTCTDVYEPNDTNYEAKACLVDELQVHNFHSAMDEDWARVGLASNYIYTVTIKQLGDNSDTVLDVYQEKPGGILYSIASRDWWGPGAGEEESVSISYPDPGIYYVRASSADTNLWGEGSDYELSIAVQGGAPGIFLVGVVDRGASIWQSPSGAYAVVDGVSTHQFNSAVLIDLTGEGYSYGTHTVEVFAAGYTAAEHPALPGQITNRFMDLYGNPRDIVFTNDGICAPMFIFESLVTAEAEIRDAWTHAFVEDVEISFGVDSGPFSNLTYRGCPEFTQHRSNWFSRTAGLFPGNVRVPKANTTLNVAKAGYSNAATACAFGGLAPGTVTNLGSVYLWPVDANSNGVADFWEDRFFPSTNVVPGVDTDGDGVDDDDEYFCDTDPTNANDGLLFDVPVATNANGFTVTWPVAVGRTYRIQSLDDLLTTNWTAVGGPWEATNGQSWMMWTDTNSVGVDQRNYRIQLMKP